MPTYVNNQAQIFLYSVIGGMLIAFIYDLFRVKRKTFKAGRVMVLLEDFAFWVIVAFVMFAVVYYSNEGEIRGYIFVGTIIGVILYILLLSRYIMKLFLTCISVIRKVTKTVWFIISYPFKILFKLLGIPLGYTFKILRRAGKKTRRIGRSRLAKLAVWRKMLKNIIKKI